MEAPPAAATAAGTGADLADPNAAVTTPGAMTPGPMTFPGSVASREKDAQKADVMAFVQKLRDAGEGEKAQAIADAYEAEGLGLKTPAGLFNKGTTKSEAPILRQNPRTSKIDQRNDQTGEWEPLIGNAPPNAHWMTEAPPKDNSAHELASTLAHQHVVEKANKTLYDELGKGELAQIAASTGIQQALAQNNEVGDSVLAPMILKATVTAGGNSGFRMTKPEIDRVLTKPKSDALMLALNSWTGNGPLQITDTQRADMHKIATQIYERAKRSYGKLNDAEDQINEVPVGQYKRINDIVSKTKRAFAEDLGNAGSGDQKQGSVPEVVGDIEYDSNGLMVKKGGR
jgi:hypothetical protein